MLVLTYAKRVIFKNLDSILIETFYQSFTVDLTLVQSWIDSRLKIDLTGENDLIYLGDSWRSQLYHPDTYFMNGRDVTLLTGISGPDHYFLVSKNSTITQHCRLRAKFHCKMNLLEFPQDSQHCNIDLRSRKFVCASVVK